MSPCTSVRSSAALAAAVATALLAGPLAPPASAGPAPSSWTGLAVGFGDSGLLDLDTRPAGSGVRTVSGDLAEVHERRFASHTEITSAGSTVVVSAVDGNGARVAGFGQGGQVHLGEPTGTRRALVLDASRSDELVVLDQRGGASPALLVTRLHARTGVPDVTYGRGGTVTVPGTWDGTSMSVGSFGDVVLATNDTSGPVSRGVVLALAPDGTPDLAFGGGDGRIDSPLGQGTTSERVLDVTAGGPGVAVVGAVDGAGVVALFDQLGRPDATSGERQRRTVGDRVDAVVPSRDGVVVASVSGRTGSLSSLGRGTAFDGPTTVVVEQGCDVSFPDLELSYAYVVLADDGCGRGPRVGQYDRERLLRYPRAEIAPELDRLRPVVARQVSANCVLGDQVGDATGATVGCTGRGTGATFFALPPARVLDTRTGVGAPRGPVTAGRSLVLDVTGVAGIPTDGVTAVTLNLTAVGPTASGYLSVHPSGTDRPLSSTSNTQRGVTTPTQVTAKVGADGKVVVYSSAGSVHVLADVAGYYLDDHARDGEGGRFTPVAPRRVLDTRTGTGARAGRVPARTALRLDLAAAGVPAGADAVTLNLTAVTPTAAGYLTAYPGGTRPVASHLNTRPGVTVPNLVTVKLAADGSVLLYNDQGSVHLVADLAGWYAFASDDRFTPLTPRRMLDTRTGTGGVRGPVGPGRSATFPVADSGGVPSGASAVLLNVTAVAPTAATHLTAHPATTARPTASHLNVAAGVTQANQVVVPLGSDGNVSIANHDGSTHVVADVAGYFFLDPVRLTP